ncbi:MAG: hypothetical protein C4538_00345 [Nitrospiraceae bacterium]|nr:MAG: hypothetical protein C4538_00345 [Nitrospiraceae bacterium]
MNKFIHKILFFDRTILILTLLAVTALVFALIMSVYTEGVEKTNRALRSQITEMTSLREELVALKDFVGSKEKKIGLTQVSGIVPALEQTLSSLGLKAKVLRPLEKVKIKDYSEEGAELEIQDTDLNSIVNLLYRIDSDPVPMKIKDIAVRSAFENPDKLMLKMTVSLLSK